MNRITLSNKEIVLHKHGIEYKCNSFNGSPLDNGDKIYRKEDVKQFIQELKQELREKNLFHFNKIQEILDKKETGQIDINLDVQFKIHSNCHKEYVGIIKIIDKLTGEKFK